MDTELRRQDGNRPIPFKAVSSQIGDGKPFGTQTLNLRGKYESEREGSPVRFYGTIDYISPLNSVPESITKLTDVFRTVKNGKFSHITTIKPNICIKKGVIEQSFGIQEELEVVYPYSDIDIFRATKISRNIYGEDLYNFTAPDLESLDTVFLYFSTSDMAIGDRISGRIFNDDGTVVQPERVLSLPLEDGSVLDYGFDPIQEFIVNRVEQPYKNGFTYLYKYVTLTLSPIGEFTRECIYSDYKVEILEPTTYSDTNYTEEGC